MSALTMTLFRKDLFLLVYLSCASGTFLAPPTTGNREWRLWSGPPSVLCIGEALLDCIANDANVSAEKMMRDGSFTAFPGGAPANVAIALSKLGTSAAFAGCVGKDEDGTILSNLFVQQNVNVKLLQRARASYPTRRVMVTKNQDGDRSFAGFYGDLPADAFADCHYEASCIFKDDDEAALAVIDSAKWLVCGTLSLAFDQTADTMKRIVDRGLEGGARLCVDVNWRPVFWPADAETRARTEIVRFARRAHVVKLTDEEAEWLLNMTAHEALADPSLVHQHFPNAIAVLVTAGAKGASYSMMGHRGMVEPFPVKVVETTGAGDAFTAGFLHRALESDIFGKDIPGQLVDASSIDKIVRFASAVGALTCTAEGAIAAQPTLPEVESFLSRLPVR
jgi:fructokinase